MRDWQDYFYRFIKPSDKLTDPLERQRASILASLFILSMLTSLFSFVILPPIIQWQVNYFYGIFGVLSYIPLLLLARSRYFRLAAWLFLLTASSLLVSSVVFSQNPNAPLSLNFFLAIILLAGLILNPVETLAFAILSLVVQIIVAYYKAAPSYITINATTLTIIVSMSVMAFSALTDMFKRRALESEARYRELMKANSEGILIIDEKDARILDANAAIETMLGYKPEELIGRYPVEFLDAESKSTARNTWEKRDKGIPVETLANHKDGSKIYVEAILKPYDYLNKNAFVLTLLDISERKQVEALVIESEKRFRAIFNESSHFIGVLDVRGKLLEINEQGYEYFGLRPEETVGRYLWDIPQWAHSENSKQRIKQVIREVSEGGFVRYDVEVRDRNQQPAFLDFTLKPVMDMSGEVSMLIADSRDITAYKIAEQKRVEYERRYDALFMKTADAVFVFTLDGYYITANERALAMLGYEASEIVGAPTSTFIVPEEYPASMDVLQKLLDGEEVDIYERRLRRKNGEVFSVEISLMLVRDAHNRPMYFQSLVRDISERKRMERHQFEMALEQERARLLQHFIEQASHHFRTPITNLKTSVYLLPNFLDNEAKRQHHIKVVNQELLRLQTLLDDLLTVLRLQKTNTEFSLGKIHVQQFMAELRANQEGRAYYADFVWDWEIPESEALLIGDKAVLARALLNLLDNATSYTKAGGKIHVRGAIMEAWLMIEIADTGIGIREEDLARIFEDFFRTSDAMSAKATSSGLGLTICKSIIERHRGTIRVSSEFGKGSRFRVLLPLYTEWTSTPPPLPAEFE